MLPVRPFAPGLSRVPKWRNWQTRMVQVHVLARVWGFESLLRHQIRDASNCLKIADNFSGAGEARQSRNYGKSASKTALFREDNPGQLGDAQRRIFYGPGVENFDVTLRKEVRIHEAGSLESRMEVLNAFNPTHFYGPACVDGQVEDPNFGQIVSAQSPRLVQVVAKFSF
jgi:hypothetical protein